MIIPSGKSQLNSPEKIFCKKIFFYNKIKNLFSGKLAFLYRNFVPENVSGFTFEFFRKSFSKIETPTFYSKMPFNANS